jgi:O-antigen/teichoic acid export membrane protein
MMAGQATIVMVTDVFGVLLNLALNLWLIPRYGITGAGIAWAAEIIVVSVISLVEAWWIMRVFPFGVGLAKGMAAGLLAFLTGYGIHYLTTGAMQLVIGGLTVCLVYVGAILLLGLGPDDRLVLSTIWRRLRLGSA